MITQQTRQAHRQQGDCRQPRGIHYHLMKQFRQGKKSAKGGKKCYAKDVFMVPPCAIRYSRCAGIEVRVSVSRNQPTNHDEI